MVGPDCAWRSPLSMCVRLDSQLVTRACKYTAFIRYAQRASCQESSSSTRRIMAAERIAQIGHDTTVTPIADTSRLPCRDCSSYPRCTAMVETPAPRRLAAATRLVSHSTHPHSTASPTRLGTSCSQIWSTSFSFRRSQNGTWFILTQVVGFLHRSAIARRCTRAAKRVRVTTHKCSKIRSDLFRPCQPSHHCRCQPSQPPQCCRSAP